MRRHCPLKTRTIRNALKTPKGEWGRFTPSMVLTPDAKQQNPYARKPEKTREEKAGNYLVDDEYLVTALVPSDTACLASSPGRIRRTLRLGLDVIGRCGMRDDSRGLNFPRGDGRLLVVRRQLRGLGRDALENVWVASENVQFEQGAGRLTVDERVEDRHGTVRDASVGVDLLQDCEGPSARCAFAISNRINKPL